MTTCQDMIVALDRRYPQSRGRWANVVEFQAIDYLSVACWESMGYVVNGHEIKVSRADWLRELKDPYKSAVTMPFCDHWWLVAPKGVAKEEEIPDGWGFLEWNGFSFWVVKQAPVLRPKFERSKWHSISTNQGVFEPNPVYFERRGFAMMARRFSYAQADRDALLPLVADPRPFLDAAAQRTGRMAITDRERQNEIRKRITAAKKKRQQAKFGD